MVLEHTLEWMGARELRYQPMLDYWLRMAGATFGCIGMAAALACWKPLKFAILIQLFPAFHGFLGIVLAVAAIQNDLHLPVHTSFAVDISFCFAVALLIQLPLLFGGTREIT